jgi:hypothetical protein
MPEFKPRLGASRYDHADYFEWWDRATATAQFYGCAHRLRESVIVSLIEHYIRDCQEKGTKPTMEYFIRCVAAFGDRDMKTISRLVSMLEGREPLEFEKPKAINEMPGRQRQREANQTKTVGAFLDQVKSTPGAPLAIEKPQRTQAVSKRLPEGWYSREMVLAWMRENHPADLDKVDDFFEYLGVDQKYGPLWKMIGRHAAN